MAITTLIGHVSRALDFRNKESLFIGIGKTTAWEDENSPPDPLNTDTLVDPVGYKQVESIFMVVPDPNGTLSYKDSRWRIVPEEEAIAQGARWVYLSVYVAYEELPTNISYRQVGAYTNLTRKEGVPSGKYALLPSEVESVGLLEVLDNRKPIYREPDQREQLIIIIEF